MSCISYTFTVVIDKNLPSEILVFPMLVGHYLMENLEITVGFLMCYFVFYVRAKRVGIVAENSDYISQGCDTCERPVKKMPVKNMPSKRKPLSPYMFFYLTKLSIIVENNPEMNFGKVGKILGQMWRELPPNEKAIYNQMALDDKKSCEIEYFAALMFISGQRKAWSLNVLNKLFNVVFLQVPEFFKEKPAI